MWTNLHKHLPFTRHKPGEPPSTPTSTESYGDSKSHNNKRPLNYPRRPSQMAPPAKGAEVTSSYIDGHWTNNSLTDLLAAQTEAHKQAIARPTPLPVRKPYSIAPGGHLETIAWLARPDSPESYERLFYARDEATRRKSARLAQGFYISRPLSEPEKEQQQDHDAKTGVGLGISIQGQDTGGYSAMSQSGELDTHGYSAIPQGDEPDVHEDDDRLSTAYRCSTDSTDSDSSSSGSAASFKRWASGGDAGEGSFAEFANEWAENVARNSNVTPPPSPGPPLRRQGRYHYTSDAAARRFDYMKSYLSLRENSRPINILLLIIHYRRSAACDAARTNPAFLRAGLEIDWTGILDELPLSEHDTDLEQKYNRLVVKTWLDYGGYLFAETDRYDNDIFVREDEENAKSSWPELVAQEDLEGSKCPYPFCDYRVWKRLNGLPSGDMMRKWQKPGSSRLSLTLPAPP